MADDDFHNYLMIECIDALLKACVVWLKDKG